eukprot:6473179-Heterocapsa_arctica.AAC.1
MTGDGVPGLAESERRSSRRTGVTARLADLESDAEEVTVILSGAVEGSSGGGRGSLVRRFKVWPRNSSTVA